jgi:hypothetical protein
LEGGEEKEIKDEIGRRGQGYGGRATVYLNVKAVRGENDK